MTNALKSLQLRALELSTERLYIRAIEDADVKAIYSIHSEAEVNVYLPYDTWQSWDDAKHWYAKIKQRETQGEAQQLVILRNTDQQLVGTCIVFHYTEKDKSCEIGYVLGRTFWSRGYMYEAVKAIRDSLIAYPKIDQLRAVVDSQNLASLALLDKLNFTIKTKLQADNRTSVYLRYLPERLK